MQKTIAALVVVAMFVVAGFLVGQRTGVGFLNGQIIFFPSSPSSSRSTSSFFPSTSMGPSSSSSTSSFVPSMSSSESCSDEYLGALDQASGNNNPLTADLMAAVAKPKCDNVVKTWVLTGGPFSAPTVNALKALLQQKCVDTRREPAACASRPVTCVTDLDKGDNGISVKFIGWIRCSPRPPHGAGSCNATRYCTEFK